MATLQKIAAQNYTVEQVREILQQAFDILEDVDLTHEQRVALLPSILELLGQQSVTFVAENPLPNFAIPRNHRG